MIRVIKNKDILACQNPGSHYNNGVIFTIIIKIYYQQQHRSYPPRQPRVIQESDIIEGIPN